MKINAPHDDGNFSQNSANHRVYVELEQAFGGKKIVPLDIPKDKSDPTYDAERHIKKFRLPARISGVCTETGLLLTGSTLVTSISGRYFLNKVLQDWRVAMLLFFVLIVFPSFLFFYTSSKVADMKFAFILRFLSVAFGGIVGGSYA